MPYDAPDEPAIVSKARGWLGTTWQHRSASNQGVDALGLILGVAELGHLIDAVPHYSPDWGRSDVCLLKTAAWCTGARLTDPYVLKRDGPRAGAILGFEMAPRAGIKHLAIYTGLSLIHACWARAVVESTPAPWWTDRIRGGFYLEADLHA